MKTLQALVLGTSMLALSGGVASAQLVQPQNNPGINAPGGSSMPGRRLTGRGGGDPEAYHNGSRIVGPGDPSTRRYSRWRDRDGDGRWDRRRWRDRGYYGGYYGWRDRDWYDPYGPFAGGYTGIWPFAGFSALVPGTYDDPVWIEPAPRRRVWVERRGRYGNGPDYRRSVANPSRGAQSGT